MKLFYTIPEYEAAGMSRAEIYREEKKGNLKLSKKGRRTIITLANHEAFQAYLGNLPEYSEATKAKLATHHPARKAAHGRKA